ncbi:MAG: response regulator [Magnetococcales bacterium]|nr:response regulator [Magnetococcales bacterium]
MGGRIWAESQVDSGSIFHVALPLRLATPPVQPNPPSPENSFPTIGESSLRILLVDDSEDHNILINHFLKGTPHRLTIVSNGEEAVQLIKKGTFDLVVMDVQMPEMDGYTATRLIRQWEQKTNHYSLPIIALTAHALSGEAERVQDAGYDLYLTKPIRKQRFLEVIQHMGEKIATRAQPVTMEQKTLRTHSPVMGMGRNCEV